MTDEEDAARREPAQASNLVLEAAAQIASWCEQRKTAAITDANLQIRTIWVLLVGGVILLMILPRLVALIDYTAATLPPDAVTEAEAALSLMETNENEMLEEFRQADADLALRQDELIEANGLKVAATEAFHDPFENLLAVWRIVQEIEKFTIFVVQERVNGELIAAGYEETDEGTQILLMRSTDGQMWLPVRPEQAGVRIEGILYSLTSTLDGGLIAAGNEETDEGNRILLMRSADGETWLPVRPEEAGARIAGRLYGLASAPDGGLIAAGYEETDEGRQILLMRSTDGQTWVPVRPEEEDARIAGSLFSLSSAAGSGLIATGHEGYDEGDQILLMRSTDGQTWLPVRPEEAGVRIAGRLDGLAPVPDGGLVAAGSEETDEGRQILLIRSTDGQAWFPVRPEEAGARIEGSLFSLASAPDGGLIAAGFEQTDGGRQILLMRSTDGQTWSPFRLEIGGSGTAGGYRGVSYSAEGTLYAFGWRHPFMWNAPTERVSVAEALLDGEPVPDFAVPAGSADRAEAVRESTSAAEIARERADQQQAIRDQAKATLERQTAAVAQIREANTNLEDALRRTEPVRQASWVATRLAVIALLIFLVQIVVNRYRYLQRLADFYDGRAQAFRMLATSGPAAAGAMLHEVSLNDLIAGLSPGGISFGRAAEPPTQQLMSVLQAAIKK